MPRFRIVRRCAPSIVMMVTLLPACTSGGGPVGDETAGPAPPAGDTSPTEQFASPAASRETTPATPRPATSSPEDVAATEAVAALKRFNAVLDEITKDPDRSIDELNELATDDALWWARDFVTRVREQGWIVEGSTVLEDIAVEDVRLHGGGRVVVSIETCVNVSNYLGYDRNGDPVALPGRPEHLFIDWEVWRIDGVWAVAKTGHLRETPEVQTCEP